MKKLVFAANGHPRTNNDLVHLQEAIIDIGNAIGMLCSDDGVTPLILISGLKQTVAVGGTNATESWWYYNNELMYCGPMSDIRDVTHLRLSNVFAANNPYLGKNIHNIRTLIAVTTGNDIIGDIPFIYTRGVDNLCNRALLRPEAWRYVGAIGQISWQNGFGSGTVGVSAQNLRFRKIYGVVHITGSIDFNPFASIVGGGPLTICTLPAGYLPEFDYSVVIAVRTPLHPITKGFNAKFTITSTGLLRCSLVFDAGTSNVDLTQTWGGDMIALTYNAQ
jgi:hypothetical protein